MEFSKQNDISDVQTEIIAVVQGSPNFTSRLFKTTTIDILEKGTRLSTNGWVNFVLL